LLTLINVRIGFGEEKKQHKKKKARKEVIILVSEMEGMVKCSANYVPLTPISFLERSAIVYRDRISVIDGDVKYTWKETHERCIRLASALAHLGISPGDVVTTTLSPPRFKAFLC
jgi:non-ribosomal peptide synthetase component E (peptide arylation enzyme)